MKQYVHLIHLGQIATALLLCIGVSGCGRELKTNTENAYFPLTVGSMWKFERGTASLLIKAVRTETVHGMAFTVFDEMIRNSPEKLYTRTRSYRADSSGNIERLVTNTTSLKMSDHPSLIWFRLDANVGDSWEANANSSFYEGEVHRYKITLLSRKDTVVSPAGTFTDCLRIYIDDLESDDAEEYYLWLAKGVGMVRYSTEEDGSNGATLSSFRIGEKASR